MHEEFMAFVEDEGSYVAVRSAAEARGYPSAVVQQGGLGMLGDMLESTAPPRILLLDLDSEKNDPVMAAQRALSLAGPDCRIIFTGSTNDVRFYRQLLQMGAADYLIKPLAEEGVGQAIISAARAAQDEAHPRDETRTGKIIPVIGTRGGVGATMLTVNLAWVLAQTLRRHTGILDLDLHFGTAALALDKEPGRGMKAALENPERLDGLLIASSMVQANDHLSILCAEESFDQPFMFDGDASLGLIRPVAADFDTMLVDMPRQMLASQKRLLDEAHGVILVCDLSLPSLRDARRILQFIKNMRPDLRPVIVANRTGESAFTTLDQATFEKTLEAKIDVLLPEDLKTAKQAANLGKAVIECAPDSALGRGIIQLAHLVTGTKQEIKKPQGLLDTYKNLIGSLNKKTPATDGKEKGT